VPSACTAVHGQSLIAREVLRQRVAKEFRRGAFPKRNVFAGALAGEVSACHLNGLRDSGREQFL
jgi:hypothetical protein